MKSLYITYCSRDKSIDSGEIPALERYLSERIGAVHTVALEGGADFRILSGKFGLVGPDEMIPWYDHLLTGEEVEGHVALIVPQLREIAPAHVLFFSRSVAADGGVIAYRVAITRACREAEIDFAILDVGKGGFTPDRLSRKVNDLAV